MILKPFSHAQTDKLLEALDRFPVSSDTPAVHYDTAKLIDILREKEVLEICGVTKEDFDRVNQIDIGLGGVVRDLLMEKDFEQSLNDYLAFQAQIETETTGNLYIYAKQGALSVRSLHSYKTKDWDKAIDYTLECIVLNEYLVQSGMHSLNLRIFEQNKNIARTLYRCGRSAEAHALMNDLFAYLLTGAPGNLYGNIFRQPKYWEIVPLIRETYACEMFCMLVEDMIWFQKDADDLFPADWYRGIGFEVSNPNRQVIYNYMYINEQLHTENYDEFIDCMIYYFTQPISLYYDIFKVSLLLETIKVIRSGDHSQKEAAVERIVRFMLDKLYLNDRVRKFVTTQYLAEQAIS